MVDIIRAYVNDPEQYEGRLAPAAPLQIGASATQ
jgi:hypothetical protein